jgi:hypothetical protein
VSPVLLSHLADARGGTVSKQVAQCLPILFCYLVAIFVCWVVDCFWRADDVSIDSATLETVLAGQSAISKDLSFSDVDQLIIVHNATKSLPCVIVAELALFVAELAL